MPSLTPMNDMITGRIISSKSGFYYVDDGNAVYTCRARGRFRNDNLTPVVGDIVAIRTDTDGLCYVDEIHERKNLMNRPLVANIDKLFIISSVAKPACDTLMNDKLTVAAVSRNIEPVIVLTKTDLADSSPYLKHYSRSGIKAYSVSGITGLGVEDLKNELDGLCVFVGNTGAGKSTLLNAICPELDLDTAQISEKLGRGKHTTRTVELFKVNGALIADTPGFSSPKLADMSSVRLSDLAFYFPEFRPYIFKCRFASDCSHISDAGCAVCSAASDGVIGIERLNNYKKIYEEIKNDKNYKRY